MSIDKGIFGNGVNFQDRYIPDQEKLSRLVAYWKDMGLKIVLTSGTFDLVHIGHAKYLEEAKKFGDILIVGVDSDEKVRERKGPDRPIVSEMERIGMLVHLRYVDVITLKNLSDPELHLLKMVQPDVLVLSETTGHKDNKMEKMKEFCGRIEILEPQAQTSTSAKVRRLHVSGAKQFAEKATKKIAVVIEESLRELDGD